MYGSITQVGPKSWRLKVYAGRDEQGRKRWQYEFHKSREDAEAARVRRMVHPLASAGTGLHGNPRERVWQHLQEWIGDQERRVRLGELAPRTFERYAAFVGRVRDDTLGAMRLRDLSARHLEDFYRRMLDAGLKPTTVHHMHMALHRALADALRRGRIGGNPAEVAEPPKRQRCDLDVWTEAEVLAFLSEAEQSSPHYPLYLFIYSTQTRLGEALGLRWREVDFAEGIVAIEHTLQRVSQKTSQRLLGGRRVHVKGPKTAASRRIVALSPDGQAFEVLRRLKTAQTEAMRKAHGRCEEGLECRVPTCPRWHDTGLVFAQSNGKALHDNNIRQRDLRRLCKKLGLSRKRALHNLRHAGTTHLIDRGVNPKVVQERGGWASTAFFMNTYAHVLKGMQEQAARAVEDVLKGCTSKVPPATGPVPRKAAPDAAIRAR